MPPSTDFPVAIVTEEFANFLIQNATVTSADSLITVHVVSNRPRQYVIMICISVAFCLVALCLLSVLWDFLKRSNSDKRDVSENRNPNTTRQQQQSRYRSQEHNEREERQNSRPQRSEGIELRQLAYYNQQEEGQRIRPPNTVLARQSLSETRQHQETTQQRQQEGVGRQRNDNRQQRHHNRPQLLEERRPREATQQQNTSQQVQNREPFYGNVQPSSNGHRQFNIQNESCRACPICLVDFNNGETVRVLTCDPDHIFHNVCLQQWFTTNIQRECPVCRQSATERTTQPQETEHRRQLSTQQHQQGRHMRPPNMVLANASGRTRQSLSETRQHQETTQQRQQEGAGRQQNDNGQQRHHNRPQLLEQRRPREATQQNISNSQQVQNREPFYGNVRPSSNGHHQFNIQNESCRACPICLVDFNNGETVRVLTCDPDHIFHNVCLQQWFTTNIQRECPVCRQSATERTTQPQETEHRRQLSTQQHQQGRHMRPPNMFLANVSGRTRQSLSETRQHQETTQQRQQEGAGRQQNDNGQQRHHNRPQLLEQRRPREATQQNTSNSQQTLSREPFYGNVRTSSNGHRQFNIQNESCRACPICLVDFNNGETVRVLTCDPDHIFHNVCLQQWFTTNIQRESSEGRGHECPVCRSPID